MKQIFKILLVIISIFLFKHAFAVDLKSSVSDKFYETSSAGFNLKENLYICQNALPDDSEEESPGTYCKKEGLADPIQVNFFRVNWSRFGSINLYKWANDWVAQ